MPLSLVGKPYHLVRPYPHLRVCIHATPIPSYRKTQEFDDFLPWNLVCTALYMTISLIVMCIHINRRISCAYSALYAEITGFIVWAEIPNKGCFKIKIQPLKIKIKSLKWNRVGCRFTWLRRFLVLWLVAPKISVWSSWFKCTMWGKIFKWYGGNDFFTIL